MESKEIKLIPDSPFHNYVEVAVMDFPKGLEDGTERKRCKVTIEFAKVDVAQLQKKGMDLEAAMEYYKEYLYKVVKVHLAYDWHPVAGYEEVMDIVREHVAAYY